MRIKNVFLRDLVTEKKIKNYIIFLSVYVFLITYCFSEEIRPVLEKVNLSMVTFLVIFPSVIYTVYTYTSFEKVKNYVMLPLSKRRIVLDFVGALTFVTFLERASFLIIMAGVFGKNPLIDTINIICISLFSVIINIWILYAMNNKNSIERILSICSGVIGMISFIFLERWIFLSIILIECILALLRMFRYDSTGIMITRENKNKESFRWTGKNYFLRVIINEKIYLVNTLMIMGMIVFIGITAGENPVMKSLIWIIGAVNTPVLTMISSDRYVKRQAELLPNRGEDTWCMYRRFLLLYFLLINTFILSVKFLVEGKISTIDIFMFIFISIIEQWGACQLEKKLPIDKWQTKQEVWKNPRKYVLSIGVFIVINIFNFILY